jgi:hypothetical protein
MRSSIFGALAIVLLLAGLAWAVDLAQIRVNFDGNVPKGQYLYRQNCRESCHDGSGANELAPLTKTYAEWRRSAKNMAKLPCADKFRDKVSAAELNDIFSYLHAGAKDSPAPIT